MAHHLKRQRNNIIRIARTRDLAMLFLYAEQNGLFKDHKLKIQYVDAPYGKVAVDYLLEGKADMAFSAEYVLAYTAFTQQKTPVKAIASVEQRYAEHILAHGADLLPRDLIGKSIGFAPRTTSHSYLLRFLKAHNIERNQVKLVNLTPQAMPDAFIKGEIDAFSVWQPYIYRATEAAKLNGQSYTHFQNSDGHNSQTILMASKKTIATQKHFIAKLFEALNEAEQELKRDKALFNKAIMQKMQVPPSATDVLESATPILQPLNDSFVRSVKSMCDLIIETDTQFHDAAMPDLSDYIDNTHLLDFMARKAL